MTNCCIANVRQIGQEALFLFYGWHPCGPERESEHSQSPGDRPVPLSLYDHLIVLVNHSNQCCICYLCLLEARLWEHTEEKAVSGKAGTLRAWIPSTPSPVACEILMEGEPFDLLEPLFPHLKNG